MSVLVVYPFEKQLGLPDLYLRFSNGRRNTIYNSMPFSEK
jgi:hypothetical protein